MELLKNSYWITLSNSNFIKFLNNKGKRYTFISELQNKNVCKDDFINCPFNAR